MKASFLVFILFLTSSLQANDPIIFSKTIFGVKSDSEKVITLNNDRFILLEKARQQEDDETTRHKKKSGIIAALSSALIPGSGEFYAESYWKSALFGALEVIAWSSYLVYTDKGDTKDSQMRKFGDENWSEQRYWTNIYNDALSEGSWEGGSVIKENDSVNTKFH